MILFISIPIVALVDGDAHGLEIVSVYKFGSVALRHEAHKLAALRVQCIGVWISELASQVCSSSRGPMHVLTRIRFGIDKDAYIPISRADEKKVSSVWYYAAWTDGVIGSGTLDATP
jgi:meiotic recombination protein SPO11